MGLATSAVDYPPGIKEYMGGGGEVGLASLFSQLLERLEGGGEWKTISLYISISSLSVSTGGL